MNFYYDTEFLEGTNSKHKYPTIDLISIGIVGEGIPHYHAISKEFDLSEAWFRNDGTIAEPKYWIRDNVLTHVFEELCLYQIFQSEYRQYDQFTEEMTLGNLRWMVDLHGKSRHQIKTDIIAYMNPQAYDPVKLYGYYSAYDHVVLCWLFGRMMELPEGMPMYTIDLKQELDRIADVFLNKTLKHPIVSSDWHPKYALHHLQDNHLVQYPIQSSGQHNALADAKWNKELHNYIKTVEAWLQKTN